jgi:hypothetical protein
MESHPQGARRVPPRKGSIPRSAMTGGFAFREQCHVLSQNVPHRAGTEPSKIRLSAYSESAATRHKGALRLICCRVNRGPGYPPKTSKNRYRWKWMPWERRLAKTPTMRFTIWARSTAPCAAMPGTGRIRPRNCMAGYWFFPYWEPLPGRWPHCSSSGLSTDIAGYGDISGNRLYGLYAFQTPPSWTILMSAMPCGPFLSWI